MPIKKAEPSRLRLICGHLPADPLHTIGTALADTPPRFSFPCRFFLSYFAAIHHLLHLGPRAAQAPPGRCPGLALVQEAPPLTPAGKRALIEKHLKEESPSCILGA